MKFKIDRHGDLVSNVYLAVTLPDIYSYYKTSTNVYVMKWIKHLGFHMIKSVTLYVGGQKIDSHSGEWLLIWNELFNAKDTKNHLFKMIGHTADMYKPYAENTSVYPLSDVGTVNTNRKNKPPSIKGRKLYIPLGFWFCRNSGLALPQIALQYHEVEIDIEFRSVKELYLVANKTVSASDKTINYSNLDFNERQHLIIK